jgi:hypothetical protein
LVKQLLASWFLVFVFLVLRVLVRLMRLCDLVVNK